MDLHCGRLSYCMAQDCWGNKSLYQDLGFQCQSNLNIKVMRSKLLVSAWKESPHISAVERSPYSAQPAMCLVHGLLYMETMAQHICAAPNSGMSLPVPLNTKETAKGMGRIFFPGSFIEQHRYGQCLQIHPCRVGKMWDAAGGSGQNRDIAVTEKLMRVDQKR